MGRRGCDGPRVFRDVCAGLRVQLIGTGYFHEFANLPPCTEVQKPSRVSVIPGTGAHVLLRVRPHADSVIKRREGRAVLGSP